MERLICRPTLVGLLVTGVVIFSCAEVQAFVVRAPSLRHHYVLPPTSSTRELRLSRPRVVGVQNRQHPALVGCRRQRQLLTTKSNRNDGEEEYTVRFEESFSIF